MVKSLIKEEKTEEEIKETKETEKPKDQEKEIVILTLDQVILNNLNSIMVFQENIYNKVIEGFKKLGVEFKDTKAD